jgi:signal transduction histidine kinase
MASGEVVFEERYTEMAPVELDEGAIEQVLLNLLTNARQAVGERGRVAISTRVEGDDAVIDITDNGVGMTGEVRQRMFEPFYSTRPMGEGRGLGLAVARGLIDSHHGSITVESVPGRGTTVSVRLPLPTPAAEQEGADLAAPPAVLV